MSATEPRSRVLSNVLRSVPGSAAALGTAFASTLGATRGATSGARRLGAVGRHLAGVPGQLAGTILGAGLGAASGSIVGPALATELSRLFGVGIVEAISYDPGHVPQAALCVPREEAFSLNIVGTAKFGGNTQNTRLNDDMYDVRRHWRGYLTGLLVNQTPVPQLFQVPQLPSGSITSPPVPPQEVTEWTNGLAVFDDDSSIVTESIARSHFVPLKDGSVLFILNNSSVITAGTGTYHEVQGVKQGLGAALIPPGQMPLHFPAPHLEFASDSFDTYRLIRGGFLDKEADHESPPAAQAEAPEAAPSASSSGHPQRPHGSLPIEDLLSANVTALNSLVNTAIPIHAKQVTREAGVLPFDVPLIDVPGSVFDFYENNHLFRRFGVGEGEISTDRRFFSYSGDTFFLNGQRDGSVAGTYEFLAPLDTAWGTPPPSKPPFNLATMSINTNIRPQAFCKEQWDFRGVGSISVAGAALMHAVRLSTGETILWLSANPVLAAGTGRFEGSRGAKTSSIAMLLPPGETLQTASKVRFKTLDTFIVLRKEFVGELVLPSGPPPAGPPADDH